MAHQLYAALNYRPTVVYAKSPWKQPLAIKLETDEPLAVLAFPDTKLSSAEREQVAAWASSHFNKGNHYVELLLDREDDLAFFSRVGLPCVAFQPNALCDERTFVAHDGDAVKRFDAVYVARAAAYKRLELCSQLRSWVWITPKPTDLNLFDKIRQYRNVSVPQCTGGKYTGFLDSVAVCAHINQARVGLCLSETGGTNYAATEYHLSGIPVVAVAGESTRYQLFDERTTVICNPTAADVAKAVSHAMDIARCFRGNSIRDITLAKMRVHRDAFLQATRRAYQFLGIPHDPAFDLYHTFRHRMLWWQEVDLVFQGGGPENRDVLAVALEEPKVRKIWGSRFERLLDECL